MLLAQPDDQIVQPVAFGVIGIEEEQHLYGRFRGGHNHLGQVVHGGIIDPSLGQVFVDVGLQHIRNLKRAQQDLVTNDQSWHRALTILGDAELGLQAKKGQVAVDIAPNLDVPVFDLIAILLIDLRQVVVHDLVTVGTGLAIEEQETHDWFVRVAPILCRDLHDNHQVQDQHQNHHGEPPKRPHRFLYHLCQPLPISLTSGPGETTGPGPGRIIAQSVLFFQW